MNTQSKRKMVALHHQRKPLKAILLIKTPKGVGKGGSLSPQIIKTIEGKVRKYNEKYPDKKLGVGAAKKVVLRGMGAFNRAHSPAAKSATQWGLARLNAFMYLVRSGKPQNP